MGKLKASTPSIDTAPKRASLQSRKNPYWYGVSGGRGGVSLGYRKGAGSGVWIAKIVIDGKRAEERLGIADDDRSGPGAVSFRSAVAAALKWSEERHAEIEAGANISGGPIVKTAIQNYIKTRPASAGRLTRHVLGNQEFVDTRLAKLSATHFDQLRSALKNTPSETGKTKGPLSFATINRILNDLRAALNAYAEAHRRELPAHLPLEIRFGTRSERVVGNARKQLLTDMQIREAVQVAFDIDEDFGMLTMVSAVTGARHSQLAATCVRDVQFRHRRVMVPGSRKGRAATAHPPVPVPLEDDALEKLQEYVKGRSLDEPLLMRWAYKNVGPLKWEKDRRRGWGLASEVDPYWTKVLKRSKLPADTIMYAFRHSSIVRALRAGLPIRLVAVLHDTSSEMIEKHYSAYIVDMTEDLARRAVMSVLPKSSIKKIKRKERYAEHA